MGEKARIYISEILLNDGTRLSINSNDIVLFVGANNAGKSQSLEDIYRLCRENDNTTIIIKDIKIVPSRRRNPIIADVFQRLNYMERRGSGFKKIIGDYKTQYNYHDEFSPIFKSQYDSFILILKNLNYSVEAIHDARLSWAEGAHDTAYDGAYDTAHEAVQDKLENIVRFCSVPRTKDEIMKHMGLSSKRQFSERYMKPLLESGRLLMTLPDKPRSKNQKYVAAK